MARRNLTLQTDKTAWTASTGSARRLRASGGELELAFE
jgi:hypothetical protein